MKIRTVIRRSIATLLLLSVLFSSVPFATIASAEKSLTMTEVSYSLDWEDYFGDIETFVYGLVTNELDFTYDAFPASVELINGDSVYGIGYTDYSECYTTDDENKYCFEAGFIPFIGEPDISQEDFDEGLPLYDLNYSDDQVSFILAYGSDAFSNHCVVYGQYLIYGVDEYGRIFYNASNYVHGECDTSLGSLYSYDEGRFVYAVNVGNYNGVAGVSLNSQIDYDKLARMVSDTLKTQDKNFATVDVVSCCYIAQEAITSYLLSLQEETFLGYKVSDLVAAAETLDPLECYRITVDGLETLQLEHAGDATTLTRWLVGTGCVIVTAVALFGAVITVECPPLSALSGAVAGSAIELFMEVVITGEALGDVNWSRVAISAATGAVAGFLGPYINAMFSGALYFFIDSSLDGLVGGIEHSVLAWMEGKDGQEIIKSFGYGAALGFALSGGFKAVGKLVQKMANSVGPQITEVVKRNAPLLHKKVSKLMGNSHKFVYKTLKEKVDGSMFHSEYIHRRIMENQLDRLAEEGSKKLVKRSFKHLDKFGILDANGNEITKKQLALIFDQSTDNTTIGKFIIDDEIVDIVKLNGMVGIFFDQQKYLTVVLPGGITTDRKINFPNAAEEIKKAWVRNPALIPNSIAEAIQLSGKELEDLLPNDIVTIIQKSDWVMHENIDMLSISLVPRTIHEEIKHMGGVGLAKFLKNNMGFEFFERFVSAASTGAVQSAA